MKIRGVVLSAIAAGALFVPIAAQQPGRRRRPGAARRRQPQAPQVEQVPIKVYLRGGLKTHGEGQHDYPQFVADWSKILTEARRHC